MNAPYKRNAVISLKLNLYSDFEVKSVSWQLWVFVLSPKVVSKATAKTRATVVNTAIPNFECGEGRPCSLNLTIQSRKGFTTSYF
jgi:hypothetical protein